MIMLILSRRQGESFWINKDIQVIIFGSSNGIVRIGIEAPDEIHILRDELRDQESSHEKS